MAHPKVTYFKQETINAIKKSIANYQKVIDSKNIRAFDEIGSTETCALCQLFYSCHKKPECCLGCPINCITGKKYCENTPYITYWEHSSESFYYHDVNELIKYVEVELLFLKSVLLFALTTNVKFFRKNRI